jgi:hypothetical protein
MDQIPPGGGTLSTPLSTVKRVKIVTNPSIPQGTGGGEIPSSGRRIARMATPKPPQKWRSQKARMAKLTNPLQ